MGRFRCPQIGTAPCENFSTMTTEQRPEQPGQNKRKRNDGRKKGGTMKWNKKPKPNGGALKDPGKVVNVDQLAWKKVSLENDEFDDFEEIEGVDVDYVQVDGSKIVQFKVCSSMCGRTDHLRSRINRVNLPNRPGGKSAKGQKKVTRRDISQMAKTKKNGQEFPVCLIGKIMQRSPTTKATTLQIQIPS